MLLIPVVGQREKLTFTVQAWEVEPLSVQPEQSERWHFHAGKERDSRLNEVLPFSGLVVVASASSISSRAVVKFLV